MDKQQLKAWLTVWRLDGIGPRAFGEILEHYESPAAFLDASEADRKTRGLATKSCLAPRQAPTVEAGVAADLAWLARGEHHHIIVLNDPRYPASLRNIDDPPPLLFVQGDPAILNEPQVAIVGARHASTNGIRLAEDFAAHLAATGLTITSGLALGIDTAAHEGAMAVKGNTIAVMATGPEQIYPRENQQLANEMMRQGAIISEMATGAPMNRGLFPRRNRIVSGLSLGVLVVEAGRRSGALSTAYSALEQHREVMAIPGSIHNPLARGCHALIRRGATLVETVDDVIEAVKTPALQQSLHLTGAHPTGMDNIDAQPNDGLDADYQALLDAMGHDPISFDALAARLSLTPDILSSMLLSLELKGYVAPCNGGRYMQINNRTGG